jgi:hypothetical protein
MKRDSWQCPQPRLWRRWDALIEYKGGTNCGKDKGAPRAHLGNDVHFPMHGNQKACVQTDLKYDISI